MSDLPSKAEREFHDKVIVPLATGDFYECTVILKRKERSQVEVYPCCDSTDDAIDLVISGHIVLHEMRRQEGESPDDDGA
jgi:hypothetical protein